MKDQGIILDAFRESGTLIVTPDKVYDLSDEIDDELLFSRISLNVSSLASVSSA